MPAHLYLALIGSAIVIVNAGFATVPTYRVAPLFLLPLIWLPYFIRGWLSLRPLHYGLFITAVVLHDLGAYGFYQRSPFRFSFDIAVHFYFAFAVCFGVFVAVRKHYGIGPWAGAMTTTFIMMGFGGLHEVMEYMTYLFSSNKEQSMLKPETSYFLDTSRDLTNNLLGTLLALACIGAYALIRRERAGRSGVEGARTEFISSEERTLIG